jgi:hypothetical protein
MGVVSEFVKYILLQCEALFYGQTSILDAKELWKSKPPRKCRFFIWLVLHGRSWTSNQLFRYRLHDDAVCALCAQDTETLDHLLANCVLSPGGMVQAAPSMWLATSHAGPKCVLHAVVVVFLQSSGERVPKGF